MKIVKCPRFQKRLSDNEFRDLIGELETMETEADRLRTRIRNVIDTALTEPVEPLSSLPDSEYDYEDDPELTDQ